MGRRLTDRERYLRSITHDQYITFVRATAERHGWTVWQDRSVNLAASLARRSGKPGYLRHVNAPGWPDLTLIRPPTVLFVEVKTETDKVRPEQQRYLDLLGACDGVRVHVARPSNEEETMALLTGRAVLA